MEGAAEQLIVPTQLREVCCSMELAGEARREVQTGRFRAYCRACGAKQAYYFGHDEVLGTKSDRRGSRFVVSEKRRREILMRDGYRCVHCGTAAPRESSVTEFVRDLLDKELGTEWHRGDPTLLNQNIDPCERCGQFLPGFALTIPRELFQRLSDAATRKLLSALEKATLEMDHGIPVAILKNSRFVMKPEEQAFCTKTLLVTACGPCNRGLGKMLEPYSFFSRLVLQRIFRGDEVKFKRNEKMLESLYFKAHVLMPSVLRDDAI